MHCSLPSPGISKLLSGVLKSEDLEPQINDRIQHPANRRRTSPGGSGSSARSKPVPSEA